MRKLLDNEIKQMEIAILESVVSFCENNGIKYILLGGTCLGAVRHDGFIPWDDDIDIGIIRDDYEKFIILYTDNNYEVLEYTKDRKYPYAFAKVIDKNTVLYEPTNNSFPLGVYIDVFPLDGLPAEENKRERHIKKCWRLGQVLIWKTISNKYPVAFKHRIIHNIAKLLLIPFSVESIVRKQIKESKRYPFDESKFAGTLVVKFFRTKGAAKRSYFEDTIDHMFEGNLYKIPREYDSYLRWKYGDYMTLPPIEERTTHHFFDAYSK